MNLPEHFLSCDWGTSSFRLRLVATATREVLGEIREPMGVKVIHSGLVAAGVESPRARRQAFAHHLAKAVGRLFTRYTFEPAETPIILSGMASSDIGWREVFYALTPFPLDGSKVRFHRLRLNAANARCTVYLLAGLAYAIECMRGEEMEVVGLLNDPAIRRLVRDCTVVLPGTHSKHVCVRGDVIDEIITYLTGELLELLATQSVLASAVEWPPPARWEDYLLPDTPEAESFLDGLITVEHLGLAGSLFSVRGRWAVGRPSRSTGLAYLCGLLLGAELKRLKPMDVEPVLLAAGERLRPLYAAAFKQLEMDDRVHVLPSEIVERAVVYGHAVFLERLCKGLYEDYQ